ncbi:hypothetical protein JKP88DRAFT_268256 [Tribonema minus]|uniref:Uncharacterized protein n=1 Tax=Tribonema minus TaxID=303371 RepID=A0A836CGE6_9STRA|nr:hypothetical protein JKP88DRAFT_268256 [Tribonema minus]
MTRRSSAESDTSSHDGGDVTVGEAVRAGTGLETSELMLLNNEEERLLPTEVRIALLIATETLQDGARTAMQARVLRLEGLVRVLALCGVVGGARVGRRSSVALARPRVRYLSKLLVTSAKLELFNMLDEVVRGGDVDNPLFNTLCQQEVQTHALQGFSSITVPVLLRPDNIFMALLQRRLFDVFEGVKRAGGAQLAAAHLNAVDFSLVLPASPAAAAAAAAPGSFAGGYYASDDDDHDDFEEVPTPVTSPGGGGGGGSVAAADAQLQSPVTRRLSLLLETIDTATSRVNDEMREWALEHEVPPLPPSPRHGSPTGGAARSAPGSPGSPGHRPMDELRASARKRCSIVSEAAHAGSNGGGGGGGGGGTASGAANGGGGGGSGGGSGGGGDGNGEEEGEAGDLTGEAEMEEALCFSAELCTEVDALVQETIFRLHASPTPRAHQQQPVPWSDVPVSPVLPPGATAAAAQ